MIRMLTADGYRSRFFGRIAMAMGLLTWALCMVPAARADQVLAAQTTFFSGTISQTIGLDAPSGGTFNVSLADLKWPDSLQSLSFFASSDSSVMSSTETSANNYQFSVAGAGAFYAHIAGVAGVSPFAGLPNFGLYGVTVSFSPSVNSVPLPASVWLLAGALAGLLGMMRLHRRQAASEHGRVGPSEEGMTPVAA